MGTLSTVASDGAAAGFPSGSVVEYAPDEKGRPIFMLSSISPHTKHLRKDSRCSFTVLAPAFRVRALLIRALCQTYNVLEVSCY